MKIYNNEKDTPKLRKNQRLMCGNCNHPIWMPGLHYGDRQTNECGHYDKKFGACGCCHADRWYIETKPKFAKSKDKDVSDEELNNNLEELKKKYITDRKQDGVRYTYRAFLDWLSDNGLKINYAEGMSLGLLDFNNNIVSGEVIK